MGNYLIQSSKSEAVGRNKRELLSLPVHSSQNVTVPLCLQEGQKGKEEISESYQVLGGVKPEHLKTDLLKPGTNGNEPARDNGCCP